MSENVNLRDLNYADSDIIRANTVYRSSEVLGYLSADNSAVSQYSHKLLTHHLLNRPEKLRELGIKSIIDLRETKHTSLRQESDEKARQRTLAFFNQVANQCWSTRLRVPYLTCAHLTPVANNQQQRHKQETWLVLQISRTAVTWMKQKKSQMPRTCKKCTKDFKADSLNIKVYHGNSILLTLMLTAVAQVHIHRHYHVREHSVIAR